MLDSFKCRARALWNWASGISLRVLKSYKPLKSKKWTQRYKGLLDIIGSWESCILKVFKNLGKPLKSEKGADIVAYRGAIRSGKGSPRLDHGKVEYQCLNLY